MIETVLIQNNYFYNLNTELYAAGSFLKILLMQCNLTTLLLGVSML